MADGNGSKATLESFSIDATVSGNENLGTAPTNALLPVSLNLCREGDNESRQQQLQPHRCGVQSILPPYDVLSNAREQGPPVSDVGCNDDQIRKPLSADEQRPVSDVPGNIHLVPAGTPVLSLNSPTTARPMSPAKNK